MLTEDMARMVKDVVRTLWNEVIKKSGVDEITEKIVKRSLK